ncbi:DUF5988 family protein [Amycolatopsis thermoflava]|uniref:DUF5988 family protein n=1 Tax=Amycolatopsis thermoflava TaxID=84480 RepID=UPI0036626D66
MTGELNVQVRLSGGPPHLPASFGVARSLLSEGRIKIPCGAGYEHFVLAEDGVNQQAGEPPVFVWVGRTRIAE